MSDPVVVAALAFAVVIVAGSLAVFVYDRIEALLSGWSARRSARPAGSGWRPRRVARLASLAERARSIRRPVSVIPRPWRSRPAPRRGRA